MTHTAVELAHQQPTSSENAWIRERDNAGLHLMKEPGTQHFAIAASRMEGGIAAMVEEAVAQLRKIPADKWRDTNGLIVTGLLDLEKFGLTKKEGHLYKPDFVAA